MKILHILPKLKAGGVESTVVNSFFSIEKKHCYNIVSIEPPENQFFNDSNLPSCKSKSLNSAFWNPLALWRLIKIINANAPDVIVVSLWKSALLCFLLMPIIKIRKIKVIHFIHSAYPANFVDKFITPHFANLADAVYCDSVSSKEYINSYVDSEPKVISFLVDKRSRLSSNRTDFVYIARLNATKNILGAIEIFNGIYQSFPGSKFDIYGPNEGQLEDLLVKIQELNLEDKVTYHGQLNNSEVEGTLVKYAFYLQPSFKEGMAISVIDAMQMGVIPCVYPVGEIRYYSEHMVNCIHLNADDLSSSIDSIKEVMSNSGVFDEIRNNAFKTFDDSQTYTESFLANLECL